MNSSKPIAAVTLLLLTLLCASCTTTPQPPTPTVSASGNAWRIALPSQTELSLPNDPTYRALAQVGINELTPTNSPDQPHTLILQEGATLYITSQPWMHDFIHRYTQLATELQELREQNP